jgi:CheY-like chemotaxis protein
LATSDAFIKTDNEKLYAILANLVINAIKYSDSGSIELGYSLVDFENSTYVQFYVKDTGIGIPENRREAVFERFIQSDIEDKKARQGAGLGLAITKSYVELLGGKIWLESEEGKGSAFYFTIPYESYREEKTETGNITTNSNDGSSISKFKILIAEDDEASQKLLSIIAGVYGKSVITAHTGQEAVNACLENPDLDLVLMDIKMPEMGGYEATRKIRQFNNDIVIIAQTAFGLTGDREKALAAGCNDYISKPIDINALKQLISRHINN